jgi:hypothetical protein
MGVCGLKCQRVLWGLAIGWNPKTIKVISPWGFESRLGLNILYAETGSEVTILNLYGPYRERAPFWEALGHKSFLKSENLILGGDLNFSLGEVESWGPRARLDPLTYFFNHMLRRMKLIDIPPIRRCSTWRNKRVGEDRIEKRLDRFMASENLVEAIIITKTIGS